MKKEKHFQQTVFHADFKSAVKILIWAIWNFCFFIDPWEVQGEARQPRCKFFKLKMMTIGAQDSPTTWTARRISIFLGLVISVEADVHTFALQQENCFPCCLPKCILNISGMIHMSKKKLMPTKTKKKQQSNHLLKKMDNSK